MKLIYDREKRWTLVSPRYSKLLKPTVSPDGRAYFYSHVDPLDPNGLVHVPVGELALNNRHV